MKDFQQKTIMTLGFILLLACARNSPTKPGVPVFSKEREGDLKIVISANALGDTVYRTEIVQPIFYEDAGNILHWTAFGKSHESLKQAQSAIDSMLIIRKHAASKELKIIKEIKY